MTTTGFEMNCETGEVTEVQVAVPPPAIPAAVTARQARLMLLGAGLLGDVEQLLAGLEGAEGEAARIEWEYALEIRRDSPLVHMLAPMLNLTGEQVDAMFVQAVAL